MCRSALGAKRPKVADCSDTLPDPLPAWMQRLEQEQLPALEMGHNPQLPEPPGTAAVLYGPPFTTTIQNDGQPLFEAAARRTLPPHLFSRFS